MSECTRTLLEETVCTSQNSPDPLQGGSYSVIAGRGVGYGGFESQRIHAEKMDNHYLIMVTDTWGGPKAWFHQPVAIVDLDKPKEAEERLYQEAKRVASERAKKDENKVLDLTYRAERIKGKDKYYVPDEYLERIA